MRPILPIFLAAALVGSAGTAVAASHEGGGAWSRASRSAPVVLVSEDCGEAARRAASDTGGQVLSVRPVAGGACEVTLLVPNEGSRPRRVVVTVPA